MSEVDENETCQKDTRVGVGLAPNNLLLVQEVVDDFDAVAHLQLRLLGHRKHCTHQLARLHIMEGRNAFIGELFKLTAKTGQGRPPSC